MQVRRSSTPTGENKGPQRGKVGIETVNFAFEPHDLGIGYRQPGSARPLFGQAKISLHIEQVILNTAKRGVFNAPIVDYSSNKDKSLYTGFETNFSLRIPGTVLFGSWTAEHNISVFCENDDDPNGVSTNDLYAGATVSAGGRFCDQRAFHIPFRHEFKLAGNYPLPMHVDFGFVVASYPGAERVITWQPGPNLFPGNARTNAETIVLSKPGTVFQPRWNQLDVNLKKNIRNGHKVFTFEIECFNVLNANAVFTTNNAIGTSLGQVQTILMGRLPRLSFQMKF